MAEIRLDFSAAEVTNKQGTKQTGKIGPGDVVLISWPVSAPARETRVTFATAESTAMVTLAFAGQVKRGILSNGITLKSPSVGQMTATLTADNALSDCIVHAGVQLKKGSGD